MDSQNDKIFNIEIGLPEYVQVVARILLKEGYKAYLVGGAIRDMARGAEPGDYDLATDAKPEDMLQIFPKAISTGIRFGTVIVVVREKEGDHHEIEVTTFRSEEQYVGGRWPSKVEFVEDLDKDLSRRDFTFNAMALDLDSGELVGDVSPQSWEVYDPFDGREDMKSNTVRAVGNPIDRFKEDGLRAFKACRMASQLGFSIENETFNAIKFTLSVASQVSMERIRDEFMKMLNKSEKPSIGVELMRESGLLELFMPELLDSVGVDQPKFHVHDVYTHLLYSMDVAPVDIRLAALLHDIGKPSKSTGDGHFYGHDIQGEMMVRNIMKRMKFSKAETERVANLVRHHMFYYPVPEETDDSVKIEQYESKKWTDSAVRRFIARVGEENIDDLFALRIADASSNPSTAFKSTEIELLQKRISEVREKDMALKVTDLAINGNDICKLGVEKGPNIGYILKILLEEVLEDPSKNNKENLEALAKDVISNLE